MKTADFSRQEAIAASPLPAGAFNYFMPQDMRVVGTGRGRGAVEDYLARAAELMASVGAALP